MDKNELSKDIVEWAWDNSFVTGTGYNVVDVPELVNHIDTLLPQETDAEIASRMYSKFENSEYIEEADFEVRDDVSFVGYEFLVYLKKLEE